MPDQRNRVRITYVITRAETGGSQMHVLDLLEALRFEADLDLVVGEEGFLTERARALGVPVTVFHELCPTVSPLKDIRAAARLIRHLRTTEPDLLHAHTSKAGILGRIAATATGTPAIFTAHTWAFAEGASFGWKLIGLPLERLAARFTTCIIHVSEANRRLALSRGVQASGMNVTIHNGIRQGTLRANPEIKKSCPQIAVVARFAHQKNHPLLIDALADVSTSYRLVLVGDGPTRASVEAAVAAKGLQQKVVFLGNREDVEQILAESDIFVLPSRWEGFPLTVLEAMRAGLPVVASDVGGVAEAVIDGYTGYLFAPNDGQALRTRIDKLLRDEVLRGELGGNGERRFQALFTRSRMIDAVRGVYQQVLSTPKRSRHFGLPLRKEVSWHAISPQL
jgi:glycosyltransferase involved in cell wall biosynthesis